MGRGEKKVTKKITNTTIKDWGYLNIKVKERKSIDRMTCPIVGWRRDWYPQISRCKNCIYNRGWIRNKERITGVKCNLEWGLEAKNYRMKFIVDCDKKRKGIGAVENCLVCDNFKGFLTDSNKIICNNKAKEIYTDKCKGSYTKTISECLECGRYDNYALMKLITPSKSERSEKLINRHYSLITSIKCKCNHKAFHFIGDRSSKGALCADSW